MITRILNIMKLSSEKIRVGFYPCCGEDILRPLKIMKGLVEKVIFCDKRRLNINKNEILDQVKLDNLPNPEFVRGNLRDVIPSLPEIHVFFYRGDGPGEGGSGFYLMGRKWLARVLEHFPEKNGLIITDGSNRESKFFAKIVRPEGYYWSAMGWNFQIIPPNPQAKHLAFIKVEKTT